MSCVRKVVLLLALPLLLGGCESEADKAYEEAYQAHREAGYLEGLEEGTESGEIEGTEAGMAAARHAATTGQAWELYTTLGLGSFISALMIGLIIQYGLLLVCRHTGKLPQFSTVAFVPAMKSTLAYSIFKRKQEAMIELERQLTQMTAHREFQVARILELKKAVASKIQAMSSLDELSQSRLLEIAAKEMEKVIADSTERVKPTGNDHGISETQTDSMEK